MITWLFSFSNSASLFPDRSIKSTKVSLLSLLPPLETVFGLSKYEEYDEERTLLRSTMDVFLLNPFSWSSLVLDLRRDIASPQLFKFGLIILIWFDILFVALGNRLSFVSTPPLIAAPISSSKNPLADML